MHKFLLATSAAALALAFSGQVHAELAKTPAAASVAPPQTTTTDGLVFSKDADQAKPIDRPTGRRQPEAKPAEQAAQPMVTETLTAQTLSAEDSAVADRLRELVEGKLQQFVPHGADRAGVLAFYRDRQLRAALDRLRQASAARRAGRHIPARRRRRRP